MPRRCRRSTRTVPMLSWSRTSASVLEEAEKRMLSRLDPQPEGRFVAAGNSEDGTGQLLWTISLNYDWESGLSLNGNPSDLCPLVLLHGMGAGVGFWVLNLPTLAADGRPIFALDLLGFGRSSRPDDLVHLDADATERRFVESIENWRVEMKLDNMILLGHSFGGYLASAYALSYPQRVRHLVLADSWGYSRPPSDEELDQRLPRRYRIARYIIQRVNPFGPLRAAGPMGPWMMTRVRPDLVSKLEPVVDRAAVAEYLYHCNAQAPSGEVAFKNLCHNFGWARYPMVDRVTDLPQDLPITMIHGGQSWVDREVAKEVKRLRSQSYVKIKIIRESGHHVYADIPEEFNEAVLTACHYTDSSISRAAPVYMHQNDHVDNLTQNSSISANSLRQGDHIDKISSISHGVSMKAVMDTR